MNLSIEERKVSDLVPSARNARTHSESQVAEIAGSIKEYGWTNPVLIDEQGGIIAGHGRVLAARYLKQKKVPCIVLAHLNDAQKRAYMLADNKIALNAGWDEDLLKSELQALADEGYNLGLTGFSGDELEQMQIALRGPPGDGTGMPPEPTRDLLGLVNVAIEDPRTKVIDGEAYYLTRDGITHVLHVASVIDGFAEWSPSMRTGSRFCPFPGVFVLLAPGAGEHPLVLVQPDHYIAGHIIDRFIDVYGDESVEKA